MRGRSNKFGPRGQSPSRGASSSHGGPALDTTSTHPDDAEEITDSIGMRLKLIPAGEFWMGSPEEQEPDRVLFLAVAEKAAEILDEPVGQLLIGKRLIRAVVFDQQKEEILRWSP